MSHRPNLICLDFKAGTARCYWPKPTGGFFTQLGSLQKAETDVWAMGTPEGLALLEKFRTGQLDVTPVTEQDLEQA